MLTIRLNINSITVKDSLPSVLKNAYITSNGDFYVTSNGDFYITT